MSSDRSNIICPYCGFEMANDCSENQGTWEECPLCGYIGNVDLEDGYVAESYKFLMSKKLKIDEKDFKIDYNKINQKIWKKAETEVREFMGAGRKDFTPTGEYLEFAKIVAEFALTHYGFSEAILLLEWGIPDNVTTWDDLPSENKQGAVEIIFEYED